MHLFSLTIPYNNKLVWSRMLDSSGVFDVLERMFIALKGHFFRMILKPLKNGSSFLLEQIPFQKGCKGIFALYPESEYILINNSLQQPSSQVQAQVIKLFLCSTQLSMTFFMLINLKLLTTANSFLKNIAEHENSSANKYENANYCWHFHIY